GATRPPSIPQPGRKIALAEVVEQRDEASAALARGDPLDARQVGAGRLSDEEPGRGQALAHHVGLLDADRHTLVDDTLVEDRRHGVLGRGGGLEPLDAGEGLGNDADEADTWTVLLEAPPEAGDGSAGADADNQGGEPPAGLAQDLLGRRL